MDDELRERVEGEAEKHALFNALKHDSDPDVGAIMGPLMGENPEFRPHGDEVPGVVGQVVGKIGSLDIEARRERLAELDQALVDELDAEDAADEHTPPDLPNVEDYAPVRLRAAPTPSGPWHLAHARMPSVIGPNTDRDEGDF